MRGDAFIHFVSGSRRVNIRLGVLLLIPKSPQYIATRNSGARKILREKMNICKVVTVPFKIFQINFFFFFFFVFKRCLNVAFSVVVTTFLYFYLFIYLF